MLEASYQEQKEILFFRLLYSGFYFLFLEYEVRHYYKENN